MTWDDVANQVGLSQSDINQYQSMGWSPDRFGQAMAAGLTPADLTEFQKAGQNPSQIMARYGEVAPETRALQERQAIDPATEALRQQLGQSYASTLTTGAPKASDVQSYLDLYRQIDPTDYAARQKLGQDISAQEALGSQLDAQTAREVAQGVRAGQAARGNVYGTPQLVAEAMTRGSKGLELQRQRQQDLQSYLGSGQSIGALAQNLYQQGLQNTRAGQQAAQSYLGSGQTPYDTGANYVNQAEQRAANASQGGYGGGGGGGGGGGTVGNQYLSNQQQQYGLDIGSQSQNYFNSLNNAYGGQGGGSTKNRTAGALSGAASGAIAGAPLAASTYGLSVVGGALAGGLSGYYS
jgi:hypothetical protein